MKKQNRISITVLMTCFMVFAIIPNLFVIPSTIQTTTTADKVDFQEPELKTSQFIPRTIRVAIYNEPNITQHPDYAYGGGISNNYTALQSLLVGAGYQVDELTCDDIYNHKLMTADYDVFIMVDNNPRENITNYVKEFWLGGGGIMSFDSAINYVCYAGMIPPVSEGSHGHGVYWSYPTVEDTQNISTRHPVTKAYQIGDTFAEDRTIDWAAFDWAQLMTTSAAPDLVKLATNLGLPNEATVVAYDPSVGGGRVVQMFGDGNIIDGNRSDIIIDAIDWLCPRPKGRILFDMSHLNGFGVDTWDFVNGYVGWSNIYSLLRDNLVNRSYTFDKLYPSALGNLTTNNLAPYDMLIINLPDTNFTASEITSVINWINNGGGLLALGDEFTQDGSTHLNYLLASTGLSIIDVGPHGTLATSFEHPTKEGCTSLTMSAGDEVTNASNAFPLWGNSPSEICIAGEEYGNGRIILAGDMLLSDDRIDSTNNLQFSINVANWLTSSQAKVLIYVEDYPGSDPNDNIYKGPVATALNDLGINFYLTYTGQYLNLSLAEKTWSLVIVESNNVPIQQYFDDIINYLKNGGRLIIRSWQVYASTTDPLWQYLGYTPNGTRISDPDGPPDVNIWNPTHPIFNNPVSYGASNLSTSLNPFNTDFCYVTLHNNATAIAGIGTTANITKGAIILSVNGRAITNTIALTEYYDDIDDSTYPDALEIWENEIAFMLYQSLSVHINTPHTDDLFNATAPSFSITTGGIIIDETYYTLNDGTHHPVSSTSGTINQGSWDALPDGTVSLKFYVEDIAGSSKYHAVNIDKDTQAPVINIISPTSGQTFNTTAPVFIVNITDDHLDKMWYTVDVGLTNFTFTANGSINQVAWDALSEGSITIRFYANDTLGHESFEQVSIVIDLPSRKRIPGYNTYLIIGVISVISVLIFEKRLKRNKFKN